MVTSRARVGRFWSRREPKDQEFARTDQYGCPLSPVYGLATLSVALSLSFSVFILRRFLILTLFSYLFIFLFSFSTSFGHLFVFCFHFLKSYITNLLNIKMFYLLTVHSIHKIFCLKIFKDLAYVKYTLF